MRVQSLDTAFWRTPTLLQFNPRRSQGPLHQVPGEICTAHEKRCDGYQPILQAFQSSPATLVPDERRKNRQHEGEPGTRKDGDDSYFGSKREASTPRNSVVDDKRQTRQE